MLKELEEYLSDVKYEQKYIDTASVKIYQDSLIYKQNILFDYLDLIKEMNIKNPNIIYLYIVNCLLHLFKCQKNDISLDIQNALIKLICQYFTEMCQILYRTLNPIIQNQILEIFDAWRQETLSYYDESLKKDVILEEKILTEYQINKIIFSIKMLESPELSEDKNEIKYLEKLITEKEIIMDSKMIEFVNEYNLMLKDNDIKYKRDILEMEKKMVTDQLLNYSKDIEKLEEIDEILNMMKNVKEEYEKSKNNKIIK
jgi:hypothetical protein